MERESNKDIEAGDRVEVTINASESTVRINKFSLMVVSLQVVSLSLH